MQINKANFEEGKTYHFSDEIDFSSVELDQVLIRKIKDCHVEVDASNLFYGHTRVIINLKSNVVLPCSYTLEDVDYVLKGNEEFIFTDEKDEEDIEAGLIYAPSDIIDLDEYIFGILMALVPLRVIKEGAKLPSGGKGYEVMSEDDYYKKKAAEKDHRWDKLDELEFDDDEENDK